MRGFEPLRAWLADQTTDLTVRPTVDTEASDDDSLAATDEEEDVPGSEQPAGNGGGGGGDGGACGSSSTVVEGSGSQAGSAGDGSGGASGSGDEQHAGAASDAEQQAELDRIDVLNRLVCIGARALMCLSSAGSSPGTDAAALAAGMEAGALLLVLVPAGHW